MNNSNPDSNNRGIFGNTSFRGRPVHRIIKEDSFYQKRKQQAEIAQLTHELLRALFSSLHTHQDCYESHRQDLQNFFKAKEIQDQEQLITKILTEEIKEKEKEGRENLLK